ADNSAANGDQQRAQEEIGGQHESHAGIAQAPQIENGDDQQYEDANADGVRLQGRNSGDQRANARGNAHGGGENVVRQQGRGSQKRGEGAEVEARDGIGPTPARISRNGLPVGKVHDDQERDDGHADGNDV